MNEDEPMTPEEIRDASIADIINALNFAGYSITRADIIAAVKDKSLMGDLRKQIAIADEIEEALALVPGKALTILDMFYQQKITSFE